MPNAFRALKAASQLAAVGSVFSHGIKDVVSSKLLAAQAAQLQRSGILLRLAAFRAVGAFQERAGSQPSLNEWLVRASDQRWGIAIEQTSRVHALRRPSRFNILFRQRSQGRQALDSSRAQ